MALSTWMLKVREKQKRHILCARNAVNMNNISNNKFYSKASVNEPIYSHKRSGASPGPPSRPAPTSSPQPFVARHPQSALSGAPNSAATSALTLDGSWRWTGARQGCYRTSEAGGARRCGWGAGPAWWVGQQEAVALGLMADRSQVGVFQGGVEEAVVSLVPVESCGGWGV
jgi:hypothetical protein